MDLEGIKEVRLKEGEILFNEGEECSTMFLLVRGEIDLYLNYGKRSEYKMMTITDPGSSIGEMGLLQGENRNSTAKAALDSILVELSAENVDRFICHNPELAYRMIKDLSLRFKRLTEEFLETKEILFRTLTIKEKKSLRKRLRHFVDMLTDIPDGVPPDLYLECYTKSHPPLS